MTRRAFLARLAKRIGLTLAAVFLAWVGLVVIREIVGFAKQPHPLSDLMGFGIFVLVAIAALIVSVGPPIAAGIIGVVIYARRPRLTGAVAGVLAMGAVSALMVPVAPMLRASGIGHVERLTWSWLLTCIAWWGFWGNIGGYCVAKWREGRRMRGTPNRSQA